MSGPRTSPRFSAASGGSSALSSPPSASRVSSDGPKTRGARKSTVESQCLPLSEAVAPSIRRTSRRVNGSSLGSPVSSSSAALGSSSALSSYADEGGLPSPRSPACSVGTDFFSQYSSSSSSRTLDDYVNGTHAAEGLVKGSPPDGRAGKGAGEVRMSPSGSKASPSSRTSVLAENSESASPVVSSPPSPCPRSERPSPVAGSLSSRVDVEGHSTALGNACRNSTSLSVRGDSSPSLLSSCAPRVSSPQLSAIPSGRVLRGKETPAAVCSSKSGCCPGDRYERRSNSECVEADEGGGTSRTSVAPPPPSSSSSPLLWSSPQCPPRLSLDTSSPSNPTPVTSSVALSASSSLSLQRHHNNTTPRPPRLQPIESPKNRDSCAVDTSSLSLSPSSSPAGTAISHGEEAKQSRPPRARLLRSSSASCSSSEAVSASSPFSQTRFSPTRQHNSSTRKKPTRTFIPRQCHYNPVKKEWRARYLFKGERRVKTFALRTHRSDVALALAEMFLTALEETDQLPSDECMHSWHQELVQLYSTSNNSGGVHVASKSGSTVGDGKTKAGEGGSAEPVKRNSEGDQDSSLQGSRSIKDSIGDQRMASAKAGRPVDSSVASAASSARLASKDVCEEENTVPSSGCPFRETGDSLPRSVPSDETVVLVDETSEGGVLPGLGEKDGDNASVHARANENGSQSNSSQTGRQIPDTSSSAVRQSATVDLQQQDVPSPLTTSSSCMVEVCPPPPPPSPPPPAPATLSSNLLSLSPTSEASTTRTGGAAFSFLQPPSSPLLFRTLLAAAKARRWAAAEKSRLSTSLPSKDMVRTTMSVSSSVSHFHSKALRKGEGLRSIVGVEGGVAAGRTRGRLPLAGLHQEQASSSGRRSKRLLFTCGTEAPLHSDLAQVHSSHQQGVVDVEGEEERLSSCPSVPGVISRENQMVYSRSRHPVRLSRGSHTGTVSISTRSKSGQFATEHVSSGMTRHGDLRRSSSRLLSRATASQSRRLSSSSSSRPSSGVPALPLREKRAEGCSESVASSTSSDPRGAVAEVAVPAAQKKSVFAASRADGSSVSHSVNFTVERSRLARVAGSKGLSEPRSSSRRRSKEGRFSTYLSSSSQPQFPPEETASRDAVTLDEEVVSVSPASAGSPSAPSPKQGCQSAGHISGPGLSREGGTPHGLSLPRRGVVLAASSSRSSKKRRYRRRHKRRRHTPASSYAKKKALYAVQSSSSYVPSLASQPPVKEEELPSGRNTSTALYGTAGGIGSHSISSLAAQKRAFRCSDGQSFSFRSGSSVCGTRGSHFPGGASHSPRHAAGTAGAAAQSTSSALSSPVAGGAVVACPGQSLGLSSATASGDVAVSSGGASPSQGAGPLPPWVAAGVEKGGKYRWYAHPDGGRTGPSCCQRHLGGAGGGGWPVVWLKQLEMAFNGRHGFLCHLEDVDKKLFGESCCFPAPVLPPTATAATCRGTPPLPQQRSVVSSRASETGVSSRLALSSPADAAPPISSASVTSNALATQSGGGTSLPGTERGYGLQRGDDHHGASQVMAVRAHKLIEAGSGDSRQVLFVTGDREDSDRGLSREVPQEGREARLFDADFKKIKEDVGNGADRNNVISSRGKKDGADEEVNRLKPDGEGSFPAIEGTTTAVQETLLSCGNDKKAFLPRGGKEEEVVGLIGRGGRSDSETPGDVRGGARAEGTERESPEEGRYSPRRTDSSGLVESLEHKDDASVEGGEGSVCRRTAALVDRPGVGTDTMAGTGDVEGDSCPSRDSGCEEELTREEQKTPKNETDRKGVLSLRLSPGKADMPLKVRARDCLPHAGAASSSAEEMQEIVQKENTGLVKVEKGQDKDDLEEEGTIFEGTKAKVSQIGNHAVTVVDPGGMRGAVGEDKKPFPRCRVSSSIKGPLSAIATATTASSSSPDGTASSATPSCSPSLSLSSVSVPRQLSSKEREDVDSANSVREVQRLSLLGSGRQAEQSGISRKEKDPCGIEAEVSGSHPGTTTARAVIYLDTNRDSTLLQGAKNDRESLQAKRYESTMSVDGQLEWEVPSSVSGVGTPFGKGERQDVTLVSGETERVAGTGGPHAGSTCPTKPRGALEAAASPGSPCSALANASMSSSVSVNLPQLSAGKKDSALETQQAKGMTTRSTVSDDKREAASEQKEGFAAGETGTEGKEAREEILIVEEKREKEDDLKGETLSTAASIYGKEDNILKPSRHEGVPLVEERRVSADCSEGDVVREMDCCSPVSTSKERQGVGAVYAASEMDSSSGGEAARLASASSKSEDNRSAVSPPSPFSKSGALSSIGEPTQNETDSGAHCAAETFSGYVTSPAAPARNSREEAQKQLLISPEGGGQQPRGERAFYPLSRRLFELVLQVQSFQRGGAVRQVGDHNDATTMSRRNEARGSSAVCTTSPRVGGAAGQRKDNEKANDAVPHSCFYTTTTTTTRPSQSLSTSLQFSSLSSRPLSAPHTQTPLSLRGFPLLSSALVREESPGVLVSPSSSIASATSPRTGDSRFASPRAGFVSSPVGSVSSPSCSSSCPAPSAPASFPTSTFTDHSPPASNASPSCSSCASAPPCPVSSSCPAPSPSCPRVPSLSPTALAQAVQDRGGFKQNGPASGCSTPSLLSGYSTTRTAVSPRELCVSLYRWLEKGQGLLPSPWSSASSGPPSSSTASQLLRVDAVPFVNKWRSMLQTALSAASRLRKLDVQVFQLVELSEAFHVAVYICRQVRERKKEGQLERRARQSTLEAELVRELQVTDEKRAGIAKNSEDAEERPLSKKLEREEESGAKGSWRSEKKKSDASLNGEDRIASQFSSERSGQEKNRRGHTQTEKDSQSLMEAQFTEEDRTEREKRSGQPVVEVRENTDSAVPPAMAKNGVPLLKKDELALPDEAAAGSEVQPDREEAKKTPTVDHSVSKETELGVLHSQPGDWEEDARFVSPSSKGISPAAPGAAVSRPSVLFPSAASPERTSSPSRLSSDLSSKFSSMTHLPSSNTPAGRGGGLSTEGAGAPRQLAPCTSSPSQEDGEEPVHSTSGPPSQTSAFPCSPLSSCTPPFHAPSEWSPSALSYPVGVSSPSPSSLQHDRSVLQSSSFPPSARHPDVQSANATTRNSEGAPVSPSSSSSVLASEKRQDVVRVAAKCALQQARVSNVGFALGDSGQFASHVAVAVRAAMIAKGGKLRADDIETLVDETGAFVEALEKQTKSEEANVRGTRGGEQEKIQQNGEIDVEATPVYAVDAGSTKSFGVCKGVDSVSASHGSVRIGDEDVDIRRKSSCSGGLAASSSRAGGVGGLPSGLSASHVLHETAATTSPASLLADKPAPSDPSASCSLRAHTAPSTDVRGDGGDGEVGLNEGQQMSAADERPSVEEGKADPADKESHTVESLSRGECVPGSASHGGGSEGTPTAPVMTTEAMARQRGVGPLSSSVDGGRARGEVGEPGGSKRSQDEGDHGEEDLRLLQALHRQTERLVNEREQLIERTYRDLAMLLQAMEYALPASVDGPLLSILEGDVDILPPLPFPSLDALVLSHPPLPEDPPLSPISPSSPQISSVSRGTQNSLDSPTTTTTTTTSGSPASRLRGGVGSLAVGGGGGGASGDGGRLKSSGSVLGIEAINEEENDGENLPRVILPRRGRPPLMSRVKARRLSSRMGKRGSGVREEGRGIHDAAVEEDPLCSKKKRRLLFSNLEDAMEHVEAEETPAAVLQATPGSSLHVPSSRSTRLGGGGGTGRRSGYERRLLAPRSSTRHCDC